MEKRTFKAWVKLRDGEPVKENDAPLIFMRRPEGVVCQRVTVTVSPNEYDRPWDVLGLMYTTEGIARIAADVSCARYPFDRCAEIASGWLPKYKVSPTELHDHLASLRTPYSERGQK